MPYYRIAQARDKEISLPRNRTVPSTSSYLAVPMRGERRTKKGVIKDGDWSRIDLLHRTLKHLYCKYGVISLITCSLR